MAISAIENKVQCLFDCVEVSTSEAHRPSLVSCVLGTHGNKLGALKQCNESGWNDTHLVKFV